MEDKNKNRISCAYQDFLKILEDQIKEEDKDGYLLKMINGNLIKINKDKEINNVIYKQDKNITSNVIYFLGFNESEEYAIVLKIRKENSPMPYLDEINLLKKLEAKELIPKQYLKIASNSFIIKISIEEFINKSHHPDSDPYNDTLIELLVTSIAEFNSIQVLENYQREKTSKDGFYIFYFDYLLDKYLKLSKKRFSEIVEDFNQTDNIIVKNYFNENEQKLNLIENFLNSATEYYEEIMKNYSSNKDKIVFSYIDTHTWNFFVVKNKIKFIDFEDLSFFMPGFDLANYIIESEYIFDEDRYPFYIYDANKMNDNSIFMAFKNYFEILGKETKIKFEDISKDEIFRLFCLTFIKTVIEYVFMIEDDIFEKNKIDFISLMADRISTFEIYYNKIIK